MASPQQTPASNPHITPTAVPRPVEPLTNILRPPIVFGPFPPQPVIEQYAPAWFYSAINWLGRSYWDANNVRRQFSPILVGSDVDPYANLGDTRIFAITLVRNTFHLILNAESVNISTTADQTSTYPATDLGIVQLYTALSTSPVFQSVNYCYIPGYIGSGITTAAGGQVLLPTGYDPGTGLRSIVLGSAVSQVVPLDDFLATQNEQIYNTSPKIVPLVDALVYDVSQFNALGATTFNLPTFYTRNQISSGQYYVNKIQAASTPDQVTRGQTALFEGGPGYSENGATGLKLVGTTRSVGGDFVFTTYTYSTATVVTTSQLGAKVKLGAVSLTCSASPISSAFSKQNMVGFYRDNSWQTCLGIPIYDFGNMNSAFTAIFQAPVDPVLLYSPARPFLYGGSIQSVVTKITQSAGIYSTDQLLSVLNEAKAAKDNNSGPGLSVTTAALDFTLNSPPTAPILDQLPVPVIVTITTVPPPPPRPKNWELWQQLLPTVPMMTTRRILS